MADDRVSFGPKMSILAATHENNIRSRPNGLEFALEISIGSGATILAGLSVGEGCTNGVGVVMTKEFTRLVLLLGQSRASHLNRLILVLLYNEEVRRGV